MSQFPKAWAIGVINKMQDYYQGRFDNTFPKRQGISDKEYIDKLAMIACEVFEGLEPDDIKRGLAKMKTSKFCPVFPEFRDWCLGGNGVNPIHASYRAKNAALANIKAWLIDSTVKITNAEREAYNRCYSMFNDLKWNYSDKQKFHTYSAFKDFYDEVVKELVAKGEMQSIWIEPPKIDLVAKYMAEPKDYLSDMTEEQKIQSEKDSERVKQLVSDGMTIGAAYLQIMKEKIQGSKNDQT